ncbi:MAG: AAA family ATPase [Candidatus Nomurabacteria bacterium]|jgi:predicted ATP-dependent endonuclease of OLD family|nr:AAA family ATPase [Candidatus Nomurabacteria bacterium]
MLIKQINITNYRVFDNFVLDENDIAIPDGKTKGSGLTLIIGENGNGKTSILDAIALGLNTYTVEQFSFLDLHNIEKNTIIQLTAKIPFKVKSTMPRGKFDAIGVKFEAHTKKKLSATYLNRLTSSENLFVPIDSSKFKDNHPDLRMSVNNPFSGSRFDNIDYIIINDGRTSQIKSGTFSSTRFDRLIEHFNSSYLNDKNIEKPDFNMSIQEKFKGMNLDSGILSAMKEFTRITGHDIDLYHIDNFQPFLNSFIGQKINDKMPLISSEKLGSGFQMFLALLGQYYMNKNTKKDLVVLIDEAENHLHPSLQRELVNLLLEISKTAQVFVTSHSAELVKQISINKSHKTIVMSSQKNQPTKKPPKSFILPLPTAAETNYVAFDIESLEYHNELYGHLMEISNKFSVKDLDGTFGVNDIKKYDWNNPTVNKPQRLSVHSVIRNWFHHPEDASKNGFCDADFIKDNLTQSIDFLRDRIREK